MQELKLMSEFRVMLCTLPGWDDGDRIFYGFNFYVIYVLVWLPGEAKPKKRLF